MKKTSVLQSPRPYQRLALISFAICLACCFAAASAQAGAIPPGVKMVEPPETGGLLHIERVLPLADGSVVIGGQVQYPGEYRQPYKSDYADMKYKIRNDAIAMRMDQGGEVLWTIRLGDPQAANYFAPINLLPDGRILMSFWAIDSSFGDRYFIVGLDGVVEEMLPWRKLAEHYSPRSLMLMPQSGYLGGDSTVVDEYYDYHTGRMEQPSFEFSRVMTLLGFDLSVRWRADLSALGSGVGNYNAAEVSGGIMLLGQESTVIPGTKPEEYLTSTSVLMLDKQTGEILWQLTDAPRDNGMFGANALAETPDGALLFTGAYLEAGKSLEEGEWLTTLTKVTADGKPVWTRRYEDMDVRALFRIVPFEGGYVMLGRRQSEPESSILLHVDAEGAPLGALTIDKEPGRVASWVTLAAAPDGTVYISGAVQETHDPKTETIGDLIGSFVGVLQADYFSPIE